MVYTCLLYTSSSKPLDRLYWHAQRLNDYSRSAFLDIPDNIGLFDPVVYSAAGDALAEADGDADTDADGLAVADGLVFGLADAVTFGLTDGLAEGVVLLSAPQPAEIPSTNKIDRITHAFFIKYLRSILGTISPFCYIL